MWGDPERAVRLDGSDPLVSLLFQVTGPAHIPWQDPVWQELLYGYNVWVHCSNADNNALLERAALSNRQHCERTSNLAALTIHVTGSLNDLTTAQRKSAAAAGVGWANSCSSAIPNHRSSSSLEHFSSTGPSLGDQVAAFSNRISLVGKARATAGALNLLRILAHPVIAQSAPPQNQQSTTSSSEMSTGSRGRRRSRTLEVPINNTNRLKESFCYNSRESDGIVRDTAADLLSALLQFICYTPLLSSETLPELYDCMVLALQLLIVLLGTQLYQPLLSSFQRASPEEQRPHDYFWQKLLTQSRQNSSTNAVWTPCQLLQVLLNWHVQRPAAPEKSIQHHACALAEQVVTAKGEKKSGDGLYESYWVVQAAAPPNLELLQDSSTSGGARSAPRRAPSHNALLDATRGALVFSSQIILLPFRLMSLALHLWGHHHQSGNHALTYDESLKQHFQQQKRQQLTRDVLWLSQSPIADLATGLILLLSNTERACEHNAFRRELHALVDNRWEQQRGFLPDLPPDHFNGSSDGLDLSFSERYHRSTGEGEPLLTAANGDSIPSKPDSDLTPVLAINFQSLFESFGITAHTEPGALLLYTLLQSSPTFADSLAVRSDLDTLVLPLLRTLYFATSLRHHVSQDHAGSGRRSNGHGRNPETPSLLNCPFRSISQLYVIIILLLLLSQDTSFGADAFRRVMVKIVPWYKERYLKEISLGSVLILVLLRCLAFNLNRQNDTFLLSNCCAVLMNLSSSVVDLHEYAALRLAALAISTTKRYLQLRRENPDNDEDDLTTPTSMHGEAARTLMCTLKHCVSAKNIETNLQVVYALVYHQADFKKIFGTADSPFQKSEIGRIQTVITTAARIIDEDGTARTAPKALKILTDNMDQVKEVVTDRRKRSAPETEDFTFTYEEEADPEIFFVPYVWEVIVCAVTSTSIEWNKGRIEVFPLLEEEREDEESDDGEGTWENDTTDSQDRLIPQFARDVTDVV